MPQLKGAQYITWVLFFVSVVISTNRGWAGLGALAAGIVRKCGMPKFNQEYMQTLVFEENFQLLGLLSVATMQGSLIAFGPLVIHGLLVCAQITLHPEGVPSPISTVINLGLIKN